MIDVRRHQQVVIISILVENGVIFEAAILIAKHSVCCPHGGDIAHRSSHQSIEKSTGARTTNADLANRGNIEHRTTVANRMILTLGITIVMRQGKLIPVDVMLIFCRSGHETLETGFIAAVEEVEKNALS